MPKQTKPEVDYSMGHPDSHCGPLSRTDKSYCEHFIQKAAKFGACERVYGHIEPKYWCKLWKRAR